MWPKLTEALVQQGNICKGSLGGGRGSSRVPSHSPAAPWHPPEPCQNNSVQPGASRIKIEGEGGMQNILPSQPMKKLPVCIHTRVFLCFFHCIFIYSCSACWPYQRNCKHPWFQAMAAEIWENTRCWLNMSSPRCSPTWQIFSKTIIWICSRALTEEIHPGKRCRGRISSQSLQTDAAFVLEEGDAYLRTDIPQAVQRDVIIILNRRTGNISSKPLVSVVQFYYQRGVFLLTVHVNFPK